MPDNTLFIETTNRCNLRCEACGYWKTHQTRSITANDFQKILQLLDNIRINRVHFTGGEPLLNKSIEEMIYVAKNKDMCTKISTNGTLIYKNVSCKMAEKIDEIMISVDSTDATTYKQIRGKDLFEDVVKGINFFTSRKNRPLITLSYLIQKKNYKMAADFVDFASAYDIDRVVFLVPDKKGDFSGNLEITKYNEEMFFSENEKAEWKEEIYPQLIENINKNRHKIQFQNEKHMGAIRDYFEAEQVRVREHVCGQALNTIFIDSKMKVNLCPYFEKTFPINTPDIVHDIENERLKILLDKKLQLSKCRYCMETQVE